MRHRRPLLLVIIGLLVALLSACGQENNGETGAGPDRPPANGNLRLVVAFPEPVRLRATSARSTTRAVPPVITRLLLQLTEEEPPRILLPGSEGFTPCPRVVDVLLCDILPGIRDGEFTIDIPTASVRRVFRLEAYVAGREFPLYVGQDTAIIQGPTTVTIIMRRDVPVLLNPGIQTVDAGQTVALQLRSSVPAGATPTFIATNLPPGLRINAQTGLISGELDPAAATASPYVVTVAVLDNGEEVHSIAFVITVNSAVNRPPRLEALRDQALDEGTTRTIPVRATDPDQNNLTLTATGLPAFAHLQDNGNGSGILELTPGFEDAGTFTITITVTDDGTPALSDSQSMTVTVNNVDRPPVATADTRETDEDTAIEIDVVANDSDAMVAWRRIRRPRPA